MAERPGVMFYFSDWEPLLDLDNETLLSLFRAAIRYAQHGEVPNFEGTTAIFWGMIAPKIERDGKRFEETCIRNKFIRYCGVEKAAGRTPIEFDAWKEIHRSSPVVTERDQLQQQLQQQTQYQQREQGELRGGSFTGRRAGKDFK